MRAVTYVTRRWGTADGRANTWRWVVSVVIVAGYVLAARWLWSRDLIPSQLADVTTPWYRIRQQGEPDETLIPLAVAVALLAALPFVTRAARTIHVLRPWQPHSGGGYLARAAAPVPIPAASWSRFTQQLLLDRSRAESENSRHPAGSGSVLRLPTPTTATEHLDPAPPDVAADAFQSETAAPGPPPSPTSTLTDQLAAAEADLNLSTTEPEPEPSPTRTLTDRLAAAVLEISPDPDQPATSPAVWQGAAAAGGPVDTAGEKVAEAIGIPKVRLLRLCGNEWGMKLPRYSLLALIAYRGEATVAETYRALGTSRSAAKSLLWRARKAGWVTWDGRQYWRLAEGVVTDLAALNAAVLRGEEEVAVTLAEGLGRPLHRAEGPMAAWIDDPIYAIRRSVRGDLVEEAANALAAAVEKWPHRVVFRAAVDRIYGDAA
ncbi:MAG: helix-turn-helix domain-containing protein [bacterium]|nr:helix-turn-helix domain-containing protein [bacterium]MDE0353914.1 helix-turn-helix domain-containing protein [bacterium]